ncbi:MAG: hypothetical protein JW934_24805 [Anaerolineae bacterium]|nr:hypothetical protein [Anaerolineae bacterium]
MEASNRIQVTDKDGWGRIFPLDKKLVHVGSDPSNDIVLGGRGAGVAARHLQLVYARGAKAGYRLINLSDGDLVFRDRSLSPRAAGDLEDGDFLRLGDFELRFRLEAPEIQDGGYVPEMAFGSPSGSESVEQAQDIGLKVFLSQTRLSVDHPIDGTVIVRNQGKMPGVQFRLDVEGLDSADYEIGPGPILFPNAEKDVALRIYHPRKPRPLAGEHRVLIRATAPKEYPGQSVIISQIIQIDPFYDHQVHLVLREH